MRVCVLCWPGRCGPASRARFAALHLCLWPFLVLSLSARPPLGWGRPVYGFFLLSSPSAPPLSPAFPVFGPWVPWALASFAAPPLSFFFFLLPFLRPPCLRRSLFSGPGCLGPCRPVPPPPLLLVVFFSSFLLFCAPRVSNVPCFPAVGALGLGVLRPPPSLVIFLLFFPCPVVCRLCGAALPVRPRLWGVLVRVAVGLVLRWGPVCACAPSFGAPCLCLLLLCCCWLCCACPLTPCWRRCSPPCSIWCLPVVPPPPAGCGVLCCASLCLVPCGAAVCSAFCVVPGGVWGACVGLGSCALSFGAVVCRALLCCFCPALLALAVAFSPGSGLRAGSGLFLFLCSACVVLCWCACVVGICVVLSCPCGAGWCFMLLSVVFACLLFGLAVLCCLLVGPGGSWCRVSVCCGMSPRAVLRRVTARCAAWRCVVVRCVVSSCSVWRCRTLCRVLGRRPSSCGPVSSGAVFLSCPPALCVFCSGVSLRGVVRSCALCRVHPRVSCCALPVVSPLCGVAVWPALPRCPAPLCCAQWCCAAAWCCGVLICCLVVVLWRPALLPCRVCFLRLRGFTYLKNRCKIC